MPDEEAFKAAPRAWSILERVLRPVAAALVGGLVAGAVAAGGSRVAMRIAGTLTDPCAGLVTENGNDCGVFTLSGTFSLIFFGAVFTGVPGAIVYGAFSTWLRPLGRWRGVTFGAVSAFTLGFVVLDPDNVDFDRFGSPGLNIVTFSVLFVLFGLVAAPVFDAVERGLPTLPPRRPLKPARLLGYGLMAFTIIPLLAISIASLGIGLVILAFLAGVHELGAALQAGRATEQPALRFAYAIPTVFVIGGAILTSRSIIDILQ